VINTITTPTLASFDVFDTVLTRLIGSPASSFYLLGQRLKNLSLIDCSPENFAKIRVEAERRAFKNAGGLDSKVSIQQIYEELQVPLRLSASECAHLIQYELELEKELLRPVPRAMEILNSVRNDCQQVAFISDMYLEGNFIQQLLADCKVAEPEDLFYVSSNYAKSKHSGALFREVLLQNKISVKQMVHCGNHPHADIKIAKRIGIQIKPFLEGNLNRYEQILESYTSATDGLSSAMAGASRFARLSVKASTLQERQLRNVSAGVAAPLLTGFVLWILRRAQKLGLKRLYFVSRDGQILLKTAQRLIKKLDFDCELKYLYGSRQAWILPSIINADEKHFLRSLELEAHFLTLEAALERLSIRPEEIQADLHTIGLTETKWNTNLSHEERKALRTLIINNENIKSLVLEKAKHSRKIALDYFWQEGLLDGTPAGMVDLGTKGTMHCALAEIVTSAGGTPLTSFYLGYGKKELDNHFGQLEAYFFDKRNNTGFETKGLVQALEIICSGDHGTVLGYKTTTDGIVPVLSEEVNQKVLDWGYLKVVESVCCFAENILLNKELLNPWADVRSITLKAFETFWLKPNYEEASVWGSFLMEDGWGKQTKWLRIAESYKWQHLAAIVQKRQLQLRKHWWPSGALALTAPPLRSLLTGMIYSVDRFTHVTPRIHNLIKNIQIK
jgi:predicted HAD superfamily hydrolase